jgi:acyl-CoA dehydrogenase
MYSFDPSAEQKMLVDAVNRFAMTDLRPAARPGDESGELARKLINKGWELGLVQASIPESFGGFGQRSALTGVLAMEEMAFGDLAGTFAVGAPGLFALPILLAGSTGQKGEYLQKFVNDAWPAFTSALIEYSFDFDPNELATRAIFKSNEYILNGEKAFVPFAQEAEALLVYANLDGQTQGFIVPRGTAGLEIEIDREQLMSLNALPIHRVKLVNVSVPASNRLGGISGHDFRPLLASMHVAHAGCALGVARAAYEYALDYAKLREAFGVKIAQKQAIAFMLAEMRTELEAIRLLTWEAAWKLDTGKAEASQDAYLASIGAMDMVLMVTDRAVQILGGHGYIREHPVELWLRNGRGFATFTGFAMV